MTLVATCICVLSLLSVTTAKIVWSPLQVPREDARHQIRSSKSAIFEPTWNTATKRWNGNEIGTQCVPFHVSTALARLLCFFCQFEAGSLSLRLHMLRISVAWNVCRSFMTSGLLVNRKMSDLT